jgi:hypothetical protein
MPNFDAMMKHATEVVKNMNWSQWQLNPGDLLLMAISVNSHQPRLSVYIVQGYAAFYSWAWKRQPSAQEMEQIKNRLQEIWAHDMIRFDYSRMYAVLARVQLLADIQRLSQNEQEEVRKDLEGRLPVGTYPELEMSPPAAPDAAQVQESRQVPGESQFDYFYYRTETSYGPTWTLSGMSFQVQSSVYYIGLNADGHCSRGVWYVATSSVVPKVEGTYRITDNEIHFSWSDGTSETGHLSADHNELMLGGVAFRAGTNKL